jgi:CDGSH-type Zn-finger protein
VDDPHIKITKDGPYVVYGGLPLDVKTIGTNDEGGSWIWESGQTLHTRETYALCRCGQSSTKPFCDGTHMRIHFDGTETAAPGDFVREAEVTNGPTMALYDDRPLCSYARFCDNAGTIWALVKKTDNREVRELVSHEATNCPSGATGHPRSRNGRGA